MNLRRWLLVAVLLAASGYFVLRRPARSGFESVSGGTIGAPRAIPPTNELRRGYAGAGMQPTPSQGRSMKVVDLNAATIEELETLPQITPEYARRIAAGRPYKSMQDLARTGIPRQILDQISPPAIIMMDERGGPIALPSPVAPVRRGVRP